MAALLGNNQNRYVGRTVSDPGFQLIRDAPQVADIITERNRNEATHDLQLGRTRSSLKTRQIANGALITPHALAITNSDRTTPPHRSIRESASLKHSLHSMARISAK